MKIHIPWLNVEATLSEDGEWSCEDEEILQFLQLNCNPRRLDDVPSVLPALEVALYRAAERLRGEVIDGPEIVPLPPDVVS